MTKIINEWLPYSGFWNKEYYDFQGLTFEAMDTETGKIYNHFHPNRDEITIFDPETYQHIEHIPTARCLFRFENQEFERILSVYNQLKIGDFVRVANSKNPYIAWRRVERIDTRKMTIYGRSCFGPSDAQATKGGAITNIGQILHHIKKEETV